MVHDRHRRVCKRERNALVVVWRDAGQTQECSVGLQMTELHLDWRRQHGNCWLAYVRWLQTCPGDRCFEKEHGDPAGWRIADRQTHRNAIAPSRGAHGAATSD